MICLPRVRGRFLGGVQRGQAWWRDVWGAERGSGRGIRAVGREREGGGDRVEQGGIFGHGELVCGRGVVRERDNDRLVVVIIVVVIIVADLSRWTEDASAMGGCWWGGQGAAGDGSAAWLDYARVDDFVAGYLFEAIANAFFLVGHIKIVTISGDVGVDCGEGFVRLGALGNYVGEGL